MAPFKVLSTKRIDPKLVAWAKDKGIDVVENDFIAIRPITSTQKSKEILRWLVKDSETYIAFTSQHAVKPAFQYLRQPDNHDGRHWKVFCLEGATQAQVELNHLTIIATASNAKRLATEIIRAGVSEIVFFCSNKRRDDLPDSLKAAGVVVHELIVYETIETPSFSEAVDGIIFFSPSAVHSFFSINQLSANTVCFAIGETTAAVIRNYATHNIITSEAPKQEAIMAEVELYFRNINCHK